MNQSGILAIAIAAVMIAGGGFIAYAMINGDGEDELDISRDAVGREYVIPDDLDDGIVAIGVGTARWTSYFGLADKIVLGDMRDSANMFGKSYMYANPSIASVGKNSGTSGIQMADVDTIFKLEPSLVILNHTEYNASTNIVSALEKGGINVVVIFELEEMIDPSSLELTEKFVYQANLLGKVFKKESRADELIEGIEGIVDDIRGLVGDTTPVEGYIGGLAYSGAKRIDFTSGTYLPFLLANVDNVVSDNSVAVEKSADDISSMLSEDTVVFIDGSARKDSGDGSVEEQKGLVMLFEDRGLSGFATMPYIFFGMNFENILIASYQIASYVHPDVLTEEEFLQKADDVYDLFLGTHESSRSTASSGVAPPAEGTSIFADMSNVLDNGTGSNGLGVPLYTELVFGSDGKITLP